MNDTDHAGEQLSSLVDGELSNSEFDQACAAICSDPERKRHWARYHVAVDAMKKSLTHGLAPADFADRVAQAIESEPTVLAPPRRLSHQSPLQKQLAGMAVAASVAVVAVLGVQSMKPAGTAAQVATVAPVAPVVMEAGGQAAVVAASDMRTPIPAQVQSQLNRYLLSHNQSAFGVPGMLPYARIVGYNANEPTE